MMLRAQTLSPPSWVAMLPQKFSAATTTGRPEGQGEPVSPVPPLPQAARTIGRTIATRTPTFDRTGHLSANLSQRLAQQYCTSCLRIAVDWRARDYAVRGPSSRADLPAGRPRS